MSDKVKKAQMLYDAGLYRQAGELLRDVIASEPPCGANFCLLSNILSSLNKRAESLAAAEQAVRLDSNDFYAHLCLAHALYINYKYDKALLAVKAALVLNPQYCGCYVIAASISNALNQSSMALQYAQDGLKLNAQSMDCLGQKAIALRALGRHSEAQSIDKARLAARPGNAGTHLSRGYGAFDLDSMLSHFKTALELSPNCDFSHFAIATAYDRKGLHQLAEEHARIAHQIDPGSIDNVLLYGNTLVRRAAYHEALSILQQACDLYPDHIVLLNDLAEVAIKAGEYSLAEQVIERTYELSQKTGAGITAFEMVKLLTLIDCEQKQFDRALKRIKNSVVDASDRLDFERLAKATVFGRWPVLSWLNRRLIATKEHLQHCQSIKKFLVSLWVITFSSIFGLFATSALALDPVGRCYLKKTDLSAAAISALILALETWLVLYFVDWCYWFFMGYYNHP